jgi:zinc transport system ATP-binding protein
VTTPPVVDARNVCAGYDGRRVLDHVDLRIEQGEVVAVLGANGSGKTTLVRTMLGLTHLPCGDLELFGTPVARFREWPRVGWVPQRTTAPGGVSATVREVVASGRLARIGRFRRSSTADRAAVSGALDVVGLADKSSSAVGTLSGGQQQRVLIARALASQPELLVLDEPMSGVDAASQEALVATFERLVADRVTILCVLHEIGLMSPLVRRAVVLSEGRIVHDGAPPTSHDIHHLDPEHAHPPAHEQEPARGAWGLS